MVSLAYQVARNPELLEGLNEAELTKLYFTWEFWARQGQLEPVEFEQGRATLWLLLAGRGYGKTRSGAELIRKRVNSKTNSARHIALVAPTAADARDVMVLGGDETRPSGIISCSSKYDPAGIPVYHPSKRLLEWPNGAQATLYSAEDPDALRGPNHDLGWADELAAWRHTTIQATWDNLLMTLRLGSAQCVVTTTPRPIKLVKDLIKRSTTTITRGSTYENLDNLSETYKSTVINVYAGTRLGRQELDAQILEDTPGALWTYELLDSNRVPPTEFDVSTQLKRVVVAVDPTGSKQGHECGIVVGGIGYDDQGYLLADYSLTASPDKWATEVGRAYDNWMADAVVVETNFGAEMVKQTLLHARPDLNVKTVRASQGKRIRAEPIAALDEQHKIHHVGTFEALEQQMCEWVIEDGPNDRVDARVWLFTELKPAKRKASLWFIE